MLCYGNISTDKAQQVSSLISSAYMLTIHSKLEHLFWTHPTSHQCLKCRSSRLRAVQNESRSRPVHFLKSTWKQLHRPRKFQARLCRGRRIKEQINSQLTSVGKLVSEVPFSTDALSFRTSRSPAFLHVLSRPSDVNVLGLTERLNATYLIVYHGWLVRILQCPS